MAMSGLIFVVALLLVCRVTGSAVVQSYHYFNCPSMLSPHAQVLDKASVRSALDCLARCSRTSRCESVMVSPDDVSKDIVDCSLFLDRHTGGCGDLSPASDPRAFYAELDLQCENGGTPGAGRQCQCTPQFMGERCQNYIADCKTALDMYSLSQADDGVYYIQPPGVVAPFKVLCEFQYGGNVFAVERNHTHNFAMDWARAKAGFGQVPALLNGFQDPFFLGLENLHFLTQFRNHSLFITYINGDKTDSEAVRYHNIAIGDEASFYQLDFTGYSAHGATVQDVKSLKFSTQDRDPYSCSGNRGQPGWYTADCNGESLFNASLTWKGREWAFFKMVFEPRG